MTVWLHLNQPTKEVTRDAVIKAAMSVNVLWTNIVAPIAISDLNCVFSISSINFAEKDPLPASRMHTKCRFVVRH